ncbi:MAG: hypothetical protein ACXVAX_04855 [Pseudobdellovibrio sp.]
MSVMNQDTKPTRLRDEWSLLLHSFLDENSEQSDLLEKIPASEMSVDQIKVIKKELSSKRKKMNQSIEKIKIKIDQMNSVIENLELVGSDTSNLSKEIDSLSYEGEKISQEVMTLDKKIKKLHELQDSISLS